MKIQLLLIGRAFCLFRVYECVHLEFYNFNKYVNSFLILN